MSNIKTVFERLLAFAFILAGVNHFIIPAFYLKIMPPVLPASLFLIYLSGFFEIALGVLLLIPKFTRRAACGIIALSIAVHPANIYYGVERRFVSRIQPGAHLFKIAAAICYDCLGFLAH